MMRIIIVMMTIAIGNKGDGDEDVDETFPIMVMRMKWAMN